MGKGLEKRDENLWVAAGLLEMAAAQLKTGRPHNAQIARTLLNGAARRLRAVKPFHAWDGHLIKQKIDGMAQAAWDKLAGKVTPNFFSRVAQLEITTAKEVHVPPKLSKALSELTCTQRQSLKGVGCFYVSSYEFGKRGKKRLKKKHVPSWAATDGEFVSTGFCSLEVHAFDEGGATREAAQMLSDIFKLQYAVVELGYWVSWKLSEVDANMLLIHDSLYTNRLARVQAVTKSVQDFCGAEIEEQDG